MEYIVVKYNNWVKVGETIRPATQEDFRASGTGAIYDSGAPRFYVLWSQCHGEYESGVQHIVGFNATTKSYLLHLDADCVEAIERAPQDFNKEEYEAQIKTQIEEQGVLTRAQYRYATDNGFDGLDEYEQPEGHAEYHHTDDLYYCEHADQWYTQSDTNDFERAHGDYSFKAHPDWLRAWRYFQDDRTGEWYSLRYHTRVVTADTGEALCWDEHADDLHYYAPDDSYYAHYHNLPEEEPEDCIPSYHSQSRRWKVPDGGVTFGVELEVYCYDAQQAYENRHDSIIGERDGSLDDTCGVEFIGQPMLYEDYLRSSSPWNVTLDAIRESGTRDTQGDGYGIHISVGRQNLSRETQARFILFINACQEFSEFVAQRKQNRWAEYDKKMPDYVMSMSKHSGTWGQKYSATNVCDERIEVRIFRSTTDDAEFLKNIDYVASAVEYADTHLLVEDMMDISHYLAWLAKQDKYNALKKFIGDEGKKFIESSKQAKELEKLGFIIRDTNNPPTI